MVDFDFERVIRPSSLPQWSDCARRSAARAFPALIRWAGYTLRPTDLSVGAAVGSGVHAGAAFSLKRKLETGDPEDMGSEQDALEAAVTEFDKRISEDGCAWDEKTANRNTAHQQLRRMNHVYREVIAPQVWPLLVEERVEAEVGEGWIISGQLDSLSQSPGLLRDLKTGAAKRGNAAQYGAYQMLFSANGFEVSAICEDFVARVDIRREQPWPETVAIPLQPAVAEAWETIQDIKRMVAEFVRRAGDPNGPPPANAFRANPQSVLCSPKWCPAHGTDFCRSHRGAL